MKKRWEIVGNSFLRIYPPPVEKGEIIVKFFPSKKWREKNKHLIPSLKCDKVIGQSDYPLPADLKNSRKILSVDF